MVILSPGTSEVKSCHFADNYLSAGGESQSLGLEQEQTWLSTPLHRIGSEG